MHPSSFIAFLAVSVSALPASQPLDRRAGGLLGLVDNLLGNLLGGNLLGSLLGNDASGDNPLGGLLDGDLLGDLLGGYLLGGKDSENGDPRRASVGPRLWYLVLPQQVHPNMPRWRPKVQPAAPNTKKGVQSKEEEQSYLDAEGTQDLGDSDATAYPPNRAVQVSKGQTTQETPASEMASVSPDAQSEPSSDASQ
ncbi:hypothetical protein NPX13_g2526 [Xylaria arbuscula]|uniref:Uncharacterized protein n=1 Tax=Xylaria arbuscula TaxID=114810 RepID=A0A9W8NKJ2_9PEZI|nr:hypothetical protein NPX13_g2526 [Xylaria arbuscula]